MSEAIADAVLLDEELAESIGQLNLTSPRWRLKKGEASMVLGLDVVEPGHFRPDRGREPLGATVPTEDLPLTTVESIDAEALVTTRIAGEVRTNSYNLSPDKTTGEPDLALSTVRYRSTATMQVSGGNIIVDDGQFAHYRHRDGDKLLIAHPEAIAGVYPILGRYNQSNVKLVGFPLPAIGVGDLHYGLVEAVIAQGRGYFNVARTLPSGNVLVMLVKTPDEYDATGPWPEDIAGVRLYLNEDERLGTQTTVTVRKVDPTDSDYGIATVMKYAQPGDALLIDGAEAFSKFYASVLVRRSIRGILLSNGRKFWVLESTGLRLLLDLNDDTCLGLTWRAARIANNRFLLVNDSCAPRVLHLYRTTTDAGEEALAGMINPRNPDERYNARTEAIEAYSSWGATAIGSGGAMTAGQIRILVRAVNLEDNLVSDFIPVAIGGSAVIPTSAATSTVVTVVGDDRVSVYNATCESGESWGPYISARVTHIEIWRTQAASTPPDVYYLESRIAIGDFNGNESQNRQRATWVAPQLSTASADSPRNVANSAFPFPISLSNANLARRTVQVSADVLAGGLPPICKDVVSLGGVTLCFGKASPDRANPTVYIRDFAFWNADFIVAMSDLYVGGIDGADGFANYVFHEGDLLEVIDGGSQLGVVRNGEANEETAFLTLGANWTRDGTKKVFVGANTSANIRWASALSIGVEYFLQLTIRAVSGGDVTLNAGTVAGTARSAVGTYTEVLTADATYVDLVGNGFTGEVDVVWVQRTGAILNIIPAGPDPRPGLTPGRYAIASKVNDTTIRLVDANLAPVNLGHVRCHILRPYVIEYPAIETDEDVWYSRTDSFGPENFPPNVLALGKRGDIFRRAVVVDQIAVAVMDQAVHLLYFSGTTLAKETVAEVGLGTPWADSVIVIGKTVYWATSIGVRNLTVSNEPDQAGLRGRSAFFTPPELSRWFADAFANGETIDSGFDPTHQAVRFRRCKTDGTFQSLQYGLRTERWTLLDDDSGQRYVTARVDEKPLLYSVEKQSGGVFCCNPLDRETADFPYEGATVQGVAGATCQVTRTSLRKTGTFSPLMCGEVIRFPDLDVVRVILTATADKITFADVATMSPGQVFVIGGMRFSYRRAEIEGKDDDTIKTVHAMNAKVRQGVRQTAEGTLTVKVFQDYSEDAASDETVPIDDDPKADRTLALEGQGTSLEIGIECMDTRTDFEVEQLRVEVREERVRV